MSQGTKKKIMSAGLELFSKYGFAGASIRHIAKEVGVRESAIYNHFSSKEEILSEILKEYDQGDTGVQLLTDDLLNELEHPEKFLSKFSDKLLNHWNSDYEIKILRLLVFEEFRDNSDSKNSLKKLMSSLQELWIIIFSEMKKLGIIKKLDSKVLADEFIAVLFFIRIEYLSGGESRSIADAKRKLKNHIDFFWNAVKGE
jgi:AcrR family transcriptional regulator